VTWTPAEIPGGMKWTDPDDAEILVEFIHPTARGLDAWVELRLPGDPVPIVEGTRDLMRPDAIDPFLKGARTLKAPGQWLDGLRVAFHTVIEQHRDGADTIDLAAVDPAPLQFLVDPLLENGGSTRLIAAGGSGKSLFAMAVCLTIATGRRFLGLDTTVTGPTLFLDWETNADTHARRIAALCKPFDAPMPDKGLMLYRFESVPLFRSARAIRRVCDRFGVVAVVVDSAKMAAGPSNGSSSAEDSTLSLYLALREIARPALIIDHKNKDDIAKGRRGGYGSVFYENLARMQWEMTKLVDLSNTERTFVLELGKQNNVGRVAPLGFRMETAGGTEGITSAQFRLADPYTLPDPDADDADERIAALLVGSVEPLTVSRIAELLYGAEDGRSKQASIRTRLNADKRFTNVSTTQIGAWIMEGTEDTTQLEAVPELPGDGWEGATF